jgi:GAF domain-containing protein
VTRETIVDETYGRTLHRIETAIANEADPNRVMLETVRILEEEHADYSWVGVYLLYGNELVLGPFVGKPSPHTHIPLGRGICGAAASEKTTIIVDDVNADPRYLACSLDTRSEIVVPIMLDGEVLGEIDIDSDRLAAFGDRDRRLLEQVASLLAPRLATLPR